MKLEPSDIDALGDLLTPLIRDAVREGVAEALHAQQQPADGRLAYSEAEVGQMLGLEPHVIREQRRLGRIDYCRGPGRRILYRAEQIDAYLAARERNGKGQ